ncbi:MAG TPA: metalloregulator ArsR/SmtB family transcription factor [Planctomycetota bacterium]|jgi:DNA-binding transcriptional ArsR family regulator|nr:metalloregulator ArsR/SmtB family transcription factor [Planctomycetota bacterium]
MKTPGRNAATVKRGPAGAARLDAGADRVFKALADRSRRELLDRLFACHGQTLGELCQDLRMTRQAVSKHLAILEGANLVATHWRGREKLHYFNPVPIHEIQSRWIGKFDLERLDGLGRLKQDLEKEGKRDE